MANKRQFLCELNWQSTTPIPFVPNAPLSGVTSGVMSSTNTIYSNIIDLTNYDNCGMELAWTGTPTGTISVLCSNSGLAFYPLTFSPPIAQPSGSASGYLIDLTQVAFKYILVEYVNSSSSGHITAYLQFKDLN